MTQLNQAKNNIITPLMKRIAKQEGVVYTQILNGLKMGRIVIPCNKKHVIKNPCGIGEGLRTKVNANIGTSTDKPSIKDELKKLEIAVKYKTDTVMDLSVGWDLRKARKEILARSPVPVGTVPIYEVTVNAQRKRNDFLRFDIEDILDTLQTQAEDGVDFFTIHCGVTRNSLKNLNNNKRILDIVSRGGAIIAAWMSRYKRENPFYEYFDRILDIASYYDITLSLGDGLRPGSILDATDNAQLSELKILGELSKEAKRRNVQVMIEGPGHVPLQQIRTNILLEKRICNHAPFYVLGPLVTDIACGYDHISASIGAAVAASFGADFLCFVTASEHLRHPSVKDVREGVIASRIAAHAADIAKDIKSAIDWDRKMSLARKRRDWKEQIRLAIDPDKARFYRESSKPLDSSVCTMCGKYCSIKVSEECLGN
ncbi:MAG: phosphomethylpyrimidine synthase ThiC [Candidatus Omnitrophica bacterium]|nr:phosphomethylpyrimidine synthase ThiC [Candidatus Omnitrophota bacterium]